MRPLSHFAPVLLFGAQLFLSGTLPAQESVRVSWPLVDFLVRGDTTPAIELLAAPKLSTKQGVSDTSNISWISPDPIETLQWATLLRRAVDSLSRVEHAGESYIVEPVLRNARGHGFIGIGFSPTGGPRESFLFLFADSTSHNRWQAAASRKEADELLRAIAEVAHWTTRPRPPGVATTPRAGSQICPLSKSPLTRDQLDAVPVLMSGTRPTFPPTLFPRAGRVWVQFVVDTLGTVDTPTVCVLLADSDMLAAAVRRALRTFRFKPAQKDGRAVELLVYQEFRFVIARR